MFKTISYSVIADTVMPIFCIIMGKVSPGFRTSWYMNRQMQDIFSYFDDKNAINTRLNFVFRFVEFRFV